MTPPQVRARYMQTFVAAVDALEPADASAIRATLGASTLEAIESAGITTWLDAAANLDATTAVSEQLGAQAREVFFRRLFTLVYDTSLLSTFVRGLVRMFGTDPTGYAKMVARGYGLIFRGVGHWKLVDRGEQTAVMSLADLPPAFAQHRYWPEAAVASLASVFDLAQRSGTAEIVEHRASELVVELHWS